MFLVQHRGVVGSTLERMLQPQRMADLVQQQRVVGRPDRVLIACLSSSIIHPDIATDALSRIIGKAEVGPGLVHAERNADIAGRGRVVGDLGERQVRVGRPGVEGGAEVCGLHCVSDPIMIGGWPFNVVGIVPYRRGGSNAESHPTGPLVTTMQEAVDPRIAGQDYLLQTAH